MELSEHLDTTPNYLLGVEGKEEDAFAAEMKSLLHQIKDEKIKKILLTQISAIVSM